MRFFRKAIQEKFIIVAISSGLTLDAEKNGVMVLTIESCKPAYWHLINPDGYTVFFKSAETDGRGRAESLASRLQTLILMDGRFANFKVGIAEGPLVTQINWRGRICFPPLGEAVNTAYESQKSRNDLQN
jgi:hypothetical protein